MSAERIDPGGMGEDWSGLSELLCDQFVALGHRRPAVARVVGVDDVVLLLVSWSEGPREEPLERMAPALAELVAFDLRREIVGMGTSVTEDGYRALVSFVLGEAIEERTERFEAVQGWCRQVQQNARHQQAEHRRQQHEMHRLRAEMTVLRAELRMHRRLRHGGERLLRR